MVQHDLPNKEGEIECVVCGKWKLYLHPNHHRTHSMDEPRGYEEYKEYVRETFDLDEDDDLLKDDTVISPDKWKAVEDEYPNVTIGFRPI